MQHTPSHHWFSSLLTGLCIVAGFGLGLTWQEWRGKNAAAAERTAVAAQAEQPGENAVFCSAPGVIDDEQDKEKPKPRPRVFVWPNQMTDDNMKRVEEALRRAQEALEKDGTDLPEDFRKHFDKLRQQMAEHHKLMEKHLKEMEDQAPNWGGFEGFPKFNGGGFRFPDNMSGEGVSIMLSRDNGNFTAERREGSQAIKVTGTVEDDKSEAKSITIKDGAKEKVYKSVKEVPAEYQGRVKELIEMAATGRVMVHPKSGPESPKKGNKNDKKKEYF